MLLMLFDRLGTPYHELFATRCGRWGARSRAASVDGFVLDQAMLAV